MDLIKESIGIHKSLLKRWDDLELKNADIIKDAEERGMILTKSQMSTYHNSGKGLTQKQVLWLTFRFGIPVKIMIGNQRIEKNNVIYEIPPYDELACIKALKQNEKLFK
jgi:hypothetical protein